jgi:hypothetical protein
MTSCATNLSLGSETAVPSAAVAAADDVPGHSQEVPSGQAEPPPVTGDEQDLFDDIFGKSGIGKVGALSSKLELETLMDEEEKSLGKLITARLHIDGEMALGKVQIDKDDVHAMLLKKATDDGFDLRGALGQAFAASGGSSAEYKALKGQPGSRSRQADFRKHWAALQLKTYVEEKVKTTTWKRVDEAKGVYRAFTMIVKKEGGDIGAYRGACKLVAKCIKMGGQWCRFNEQTERWEFLHMQHLSSDIFEQAWSECKRWSSADAGDNMVINVSKPELATNAGGAAVEDTRGGLAAATPKAEAKENKKAVAKAKANSAVAATPTRKGEGARTPETGEKNPKKQRTGVDVALASANKMKTHYFTLKTQVAVFMEMVQTGEKWERLRIANGVNLQGLHAAVKSAHEYTLGDFALHFLASGVDKKMDKDHALLEVSLKTFVVDMAGLTTHISEEMAWCRKMHN